jgi:hypothetical protein
MAVMAALLAGCSEHAALMDVGFLHDHQRTPLRSATIQGIVSQDGHFGEKKTLGSTCFSAKGSGANSCAAYYNEKYTGPGAAYAYAAQNGDSPQEAKTLMVTTQSAAGAALVAGDALGAAAAIGGSTLGPMGIAASLLIGGSGSSGTAHGAVAMADYNHQVQLFNTGKLFWVERYYPTQQWVTGLNTASHMAITMDDGLMLGTWASGTVGVHLYRIDTGWWVDYQDGLFNWHWVTGKPRKTPALLPARLTWTVQPWKKANQPFYILNQKKVEYPFMALATIEYRIQPGFDIPQWISAHSSQLADWMVIYHQGDKAVVWKNGQTVSYALPTSMAIPAKLKAK